MSGRWLVVIAWIDAVEGRSAGSDPRVDTTSVLVDTAINRATTEDRTTVRVGGSAIADLLLSLAMRRR